MAKIEEKVQNLVEDSIKEKGYNIYDIEYSKEGSEYLKQIGFDWKVCKLCEEVNRYSGNSIREKESDILELVDQ